VPLLGVPKEPAGADQIVRSARMYAPQPAVQVPVVQSGSCPSTDTVTKPPGATVGTDVPMLSITGGFAQAVEEPAKMLKNATVRRAETAAPQTLRSRKK